MIELNKKYYIDNCLFLLKENEHTVTLYYNVGDTLTEAKKGISKKEFDKKELPKIKRDIHRFLKSKNKTISLYIYECIN